MSNMGAYWYIFIERECVICGHSVVYKYRIYNKPKPEDLRERHIREEFACDSHFI